MALCWRKFVLTPNSPPQHSLTLSILSHNMEGRKIYAVYITDSRGAWLSYQIREALRRQEKADISFTVIYRKGAGLALLWELAEKVLLTRKVDILFIAGGICDITKPHFQRNGRRVFWPSHCLQDHFDYVIDIMNSMVKNFTLLNVPGKMCFVPEPGADLIRYNQVHHPVPWQALIIQEELEDKLEMLLLTTRRLNDKMHMPTPWTMNITHARRNNNLLPIYDRLRDGLHPSMNQVKKLASVLIDFTRGYFNLNE